MIAVLFGWACSGAAEGGDAALPFRLESIGAVEQPTAIAMPPAGPEAWWVASQPGKVWVVEGAAAPRLALDIVSRVRSGGETGLLGLAFSPGWPTDPRVFVNYTFKDASGLHTRIARFRSADGGSTLDPASELAILEFEQPWANHNSGPLQFGPDGMLYVAVGDGGSGGDPRGTGQDRSDLLGSILRLDVRTEPYTVPPDNPFVAEAGVRPEIWAYGLRNPWGMHFDGDTLWWADVGQNRWEEIDRGVAGGNYGWNHKEGSRCYERDTCPGAFVEPVATYGHDVGASITGGMVVHDPTLSVLLGKYLCADFATGTFFAVPARGGALERLGASELHPSTFGRSRDGSIVVADYGGTLYRLRAR